MRARVQESSPTKTTNSNESKKNSLPGISGKMLEASGLDSRGQRSTFETFEINKHNRLAVDVCYEYAKRLIAGETDGRGLYLYGPFGTGKTHLACAITNAVMVAGLWAKFVRVVAMPRNDQEVVDELADDGWPLVVLDDLGATKSTQRLVECVFNIVDGRLWHLAPLVITSNYTLGQLEGRLNDGGGDAGGRIVSRIRETCELVTVGGPDRRKRG